MQTITVLTGMLVLVTILITSVVIYGNTRSKTIILYLLYSLSASVWMVSNAAVLVVSNPVWSRVASTVITPSSALGMFFFMLLTKELRKTSSSSRLCGMFDRFLVVFTLFIVVFSFTPANITQIHSLDGTYYYEFGYLYNYYVVYLLTCSVASLRNLISARTNSDGQKHRQVTLILYGYIFTAFPALLSGAVMPALGYNNLWNATPLFFFILNASIAYAITKHKLFNVRLVAARAVAYFFLLLILVAAYVIGANILTASFFNLHPAYQGPILAVISVVVGVSLRPLIGYFKKISDRIFHRETYDTREAIDILTAKLISVNLGRSSHSLEEALVYLKEILHSTSLALVSITDEGVTFIGDSLHGSQNWDFIVNLDKTSSQPYDDKLRSLPGCARQGRIAGRYLSLESAAGVEGIIVLGSKTSGMSYTVQDKKLLGIVSRSFGQALRSVESYEKIASFNIDLEEQINLATKSLRETNERLETANGAKDDLISMASHQLKPNITAAAGFLNLLSKQPVKLTIDQDDLLDLSNRSVARISEIVLDMLDVNKLSTKELKLDISETPVNVARLVAEELLMLRKKWPKYNIVFEPSHDLIKAQLDTLKIREVLTNLVSNAAQYSPPGSRIIVCTGLKSPRSFYVSVQDEGMGMTDYDKNKLFDRFYRSQAAKKLRPSGTGIGLFMAKKVIDSHRGTLEITTSKGKGSIFTASIPLSQPK